MSMVAHNVTLSSQRHLGRRVPPGAFGELLRELPIVVRQSIRMGFVGRSTAPGRRQAWLAAASDIRFMGHSGDDDTILHFEAPPFGEAAEQLYEQKEFWPNKPDPSDTGFDLLCDVVADIASGNQDSERFDSELLKHFATFGRGLKHDYQQMAITGRRYADDRAAIIHRPTIEQAKEFFTHTPSPQRVRVIGNLEMIRASTQAFGLKLNDGQEIKGVLVEGDIEDLAHHFRQRVLVLGQSVFRPSGRLLRIDAESVQLAAEESPLWSRVPLPATARLDVSALRRPQGSRSGLAAVIGNWPGDETDDEIRAAMEEMS